jgi:RNA polymerase sigma factor (sigma-70 family)
MGSNAAMASRTKLSSVRLASDQRLVEQVRAGSEPAFEALFDRHHGSVLAFCRRMLRSATEADDAAQHTFIAAYYDLTRSARPIVLRPWLYGIARNRCLNVLRDRRRDRDREAPEAATDRPAADVVIARQDLRAVLADISGLPNEQRTALVLAELGDQSHEEIAQAIGCRREKVKALTFQARASLIAERAARETGCAEVRAQLITLRGAALRRGTLHRHLRECPGCRAFREDLRGQRRQLLLWPLTAVAGLRRMIGGALAGSGPGAEGAMAAAALNTGALGATALATIAIASGGSGGPAAPPAPRMPTAGNAPAAIDARRMDLSRAPGAMPLHSTRAPANRHKDHGEPIARHERSDERGPMTPADGRAPQHTGAGDQAAPSAPQSGSDHSELPGSTAANGHTSTGDAPTSVGKPEPASPPKERHRPMPIAPSGQTKPAQAAGRSATVMPTTVPDSHIPAGASGARQAERAAPGGATETNAAIPPPAPGEPPTAHGEAPGATQRALPTR